MDFLIRLTEQQINLWGQALVEAKLTHAESLIRAELLQSINMQATEQRQAAQQSMPLQSPSSNGAYPPSSS